MAHAANLSQLAQELVSSITGKTSDDHDFKTLHERSLRGLRDTSHARTNQFDIQSKLTGLVEKFAVLNRDDLADGLQTRLDELSSDSKWLPEIFSLLLELSDRPLEKTRLEDVETASRVEKGPPELTWEDITADDPLDESGIWDDVERGYHSSDDDLVADHDDSGDETQATSIIEDEPAVLARMHISQIDDSALDQVKEARNSLRSNDTGRSMSELSLIRESLTMLHGLPTTIFHVEEATGKMALNETAKLGTASKDTVNHALQSLVAVGSSLNSLRAWTKMAQQAPTLRACQAALSAELMQFTYELASIEQRYITPQDDTVCSIMQVEADVESRARPFLQVERLIRNGASKAADGTVALLDGLYDEACIAQLSGDTTTSAVVARILLAGLNVYLRPIERWIVAGECSADSDFFITEVDGGCDPGRLWHDRYALSENENGQVSAPTFLVPFVHRIFALGKGQAFLRALTQDENEGRVYVVAKFGTEASNGLLPFSQVLTDALETWIAEKSKDQTVLLKQSILHDNGLLKTVDALQHVFFSKNGRRLQTFADTLFGRLDNGTTWADAFLLTELAQSTLGADESVIAESLAVQVIVDATPPQPPSEPSISRIQAIQLKYHLPWPLQNITASASSATYSKAFTLLLQIYRAKFLLRQHIFDLRPLNTLLPSVQNALRLQQRLSTIVDIFHAHVTHTSELLSTALTSALEGADDIDAMAAVLSAHEKKLGISLLIAENVKPLHDAVVGVLLMAEGLMSSFVHLTVHVEGKKGGGKDLMAMHDELDRSLSFITAGLRGIARGGGNVPLEELAERVEWGVH